jgi:hypothetical protein
MSPSLPPSAPSSKFLTEVHLAHAPGTYQRFAKVIGREHWERRVSQMNAAGNNSQLMARYLHRENSVAYALQRCGELLTVYGALPEDDSSAGDLYPAISFASQVLWMLDAATPVEAGRMVSRVQDALKNPDAMRGLRLELTAATHFARRGLQLEWPEMVGGGTFDLLVNYPGTGSLEVECKSISNDKGRSIHRHEAIAINQLLCDLLTPVLATLTVGLRVVLTVPRRLPTLREHRVALSERIRDQIFVGASTQLSDGSDIRIDEFNLELLGDEAGEGRIECSAPASIIGGASKEAMVMVGGRGGVLVIVLQSMTGDDVLEATFSTLRAAAKRQLTAARPGLLIAGFNDLSSAQMRAIAERHSDPTQPATALESLIRRLLSPPQRNHLIGVALWSRGELLPPRADVTDSAGVSYYFPNRTSRFWRDPFGGMFRSPASA